MNPQESAYTSVPALQAIRFSLLWKRRMFVIRCGIYFAVLALGISLILPWNTQYEAMLRIEPELSTTGESTNIEAEMDVIQTWAMVSDAVEQLGRIVVVTPTISKPLLHLDYYTDYFKGLFTGKPVPDFEHYQPSIRLDYFSISGDNKAYLGHSFLLHVDQPNTYTLYAPDDSVVLKATAGDLKTVTLGGKTTNELQIFVSEMNAKPGDNFRITPVSVDNLTRSLQGGMKVDRKGFKEKSGLMVVDYGNADPVFAQQFLDALVKVYLSQAYDRSSLGKLQGLAKLEEESIILRKQTADAQKALADYKNQNETVDISKEQDAMYARLHDLQEQLNATTTKYDELSTTLTDNHPSIITLHKQMDYLRGELKQVQVQFDNMPDKERKLAALQSNVAIAQTTLDQNTLLAAQLGAQVEMITGYAHLVSLHSYEKISPITRGWLAIILGFLSGAMIAVSWVVRNIYPSFAHIRYAEDLAAIAPMPVIAKLPFKWGLARWIWLGQHDRNTVATARQWKKKATMEVERLEHEIQFLLPPAANKTLLFTSIDGHMGVTFCAKYMAIASAKAGHKTLLLDMNIMEPNLHTSFNAVAIPGLSDLLTGQANIQETLQSTNIEGLSLLSAGKETPNFRLLADVPRISALMAELSPMFDRIVIEFPVLNASICGGGLFDIFHAVFVVVSRDTSVRELNTLLHDCNVHTHKAAFFILNKR